jgi:hypothetical protein
MLSWIVMGLGALFLLIMPVLLFVLALGQTKSFHLPGTVLIVSVVVGMALVIVGAAMHE